MKTNSNSYTIAYSAILVVIVAFLLAFVFQALKPAQDANVALDKKKQILAALNIRGLSNSQAAEKYKEVVKADVVFTSSNETLPKDLSKYTGEDDGFKLNSQDYKQGKLALLSAMSMASASMLSPSMEWDSGVPSGATLLWMQTSVKYMVLTSTMRVRRPVWAQRSRTTGAGRKNSKARKCWIPATTLFLACPKRPRSILIVR